MKISIQEMTVPLRGLKQSVTVCHITDSHLCECDDRDEERLLLHARGRDAMFSNGHPGALKKALSDMLDAARGADAVIMTGDIIDFPSQANLDALEAALVRCPAPVLYTFGNHDYSVYTFDPASEATRLKYVDRMRRALPNDPVYAKMDVKGMRFVAMDDTLYQFSARQADCLRADLGDGLPTALCVHIPLYAPGLYEPTFNFWRAPILTGVPDERLPGKGADADDLPARAHTRRAIEILRESPYFACALAGHVHFTHDDELWKGVRQYTCGDGAMGFMRRITFVPER